MATNLSIVAHSSVHFEDLQQSSQAFYQELEESLKYFEYPNLRIFRAKFPESNVFSSYREYLCVQRKDHRFYVCAAPFGRSYFVSWWLKERLSMWTVFLSYIPFFGARLAENSMKKTFYQQDTQSVFLESVKAIVSGVIDKLKVDKAFLNKAE